MSDELVIDLSNYKDRVGSRVPPATYRVQVEDVELTESSNKNPMVNMWFTILDGEFAGQTVTDRLVLTEKSMFRVVGFMQGIGLPTPKKKLKMNIRQFVGRTLDVEIDDGEPYNGRIRSEVRGYRKIAKVEQTEDVTAEDVEDADSAAAGDPEATNLEVESTETPVAATAAADDSDDLNLDSVDL